MGGFFVERKVSNPARPNSACGISNARKRKDVYGDRKGRTDQYKFATYADAIALRWEPKSETTWLINSII